MGLIFWTEIAIIVLGVAGLVVLVRWLFF
jgi:hypothetical protein